MTDRQRELGQELSRRTLIDEFIRQLTSTAGVSLGTAHDLIASSDSLAEAAKRAKDIGFPARSIDTIVENIEERGVRVSPGEGQQFTTAYGRAGDLGYEDLGEPQFVTPGGEDGTQPTGADTTTASTMMSPEEEFAAAMGLEDLTQEEIESLPWYIPEGTALGQHWRNIGDDEYSIYGFPRSQAGRGGLPVLPDPVIKKAGDASEDFLRMSPSKRKLWEDEMVKRGVLNEGAGLEEQMTQYEQVYATASYLGITPWLALFQIGESNRAREAAAARTGRQPFSVPAALRTIPDYDTLSQDVTDLMRQRMGRDPEDWETTLLADHLRGQHEASRELRIEAARAAYDGSSRGVDQALEVPDPGQRTTRFLEQTWGDELGRRQDIEEASNTNNLMISAITKGAQMVGGG